MPIDGHTDCADRQLKGGLGVRVSGKHLQPGQCRLDLAESVLNGRYRLMPRVRCLFLIRKARAHAQGGDIQALTLVSEARSLYQDGLTATDPAWAWWIDEREISWHEGMCRADLGDHASALRHFAPRWPTAGGLCCWST